MRKAVELDKISETLTDELEKVKKLEIAINKKFEQLKASIKHPHFQYIVYYWVSRKTEVRIKKPWKWFSGKRHVIIIRPIKKFMLNGMFDYNI